MSDRPGSFAYPPKAEPRLPDMLPVLSRGKHRNPRKGACFMELASYLAGERWSDHPACTHPLLASVARLVNDHTSDPGRPRLAELIPSVIGLTGDDLHIDALIALRCATIALPVAAADQQRVLAVSVLVCERVLAQLDGRPAEQSLSRQCARAGRSAPSDAMGLPLHQQRPAPASGLQPAGRTACCPRRGRWCRARDDPGS